MSELKKVRVLSAPITLAGMEDALEIVSSWARNRESRSVFFCNVHSVVTALFDTELSAAVATADVCLPDGAPIAFMASRIGRQTQTRVSGPDFMERYLELAASRREVVYLYGGTEDVLTKLKCRLNVNYPELEIHHFSPPFRELTEGESAEIITRIHASNAATLWVALGCPKQEKWIAEHRGQIRAVMLGVGAAFAFHAGLARRAPVWMRRFGLEWLHRLCTEPKRLWRRYLVTNLIFISWATAKWIDLQVESFWCRVGRNH